MRFWFVPQYTFQNAVHDQVGIASDRRREMSICTRGESEVPQALLRIPGLLQRTQHEIGQDSFFGLACDLLGEFLIHARGDVDFFWNLDLAYIAARTASGTAVSLRLHAVDGQRAHAQGISESGRDHFEFVNTFGVGLLMDTVERRNAFVLKILCDAFVCRQIHDADTLSTGILENLKAISDRVAAADWRWDATRVNGNLTREKHDILKALFFVNVERADGDSNRNHSSFG